MGIDLVSARIKEALNSSFLCSRVSENLPIAETAVSREFYIGSLEIKLRIELLVDDDWNNDTLGASISFIRNWESVGKESY